MTIITPGQGLLFMKVGTHAQETLDDIIARKTKEIDEAGFAMWGYGGNTCHPRSMVQPFARSFARSGGKIYLCMQEMTSKHFADPVRADEYSEDGDAWKTVPAPIGVLGSRYALLIKNLRKETFELPLEQTTVAVGNSVGRVGSEYIKGRVDKACLEVVKTAPPSSNAGQTIRISLLADLIEPYAVFLRNTA